MQRDRSDMSATHRDAPLAGVRVLSVAQYLPGPSVVARLVAAGARACKIEPPAGDPMRVLSPSWYARLHRGVQVETLDLKSEAGHARLSALLDDTDLVVTSQRPAALARMGLDEPTLTTRYPHVRGLAIVGDSRDPDSAGHDLTYQAAAGLIGDAMPRTLLADLVGAERGVSAALLLLRQPAPAHVRVGLRDAVADLATPLTLGLTTSDGCLGGGLPTYRIYDTREGRIALAALEPHFRDRLYQLLGLPDGADLAAVMLTRDAESWEAWAAAHDIPMAVVRPGPNGTPAL